MSKQPSIFARLFRPQAKSLVNPGADLYALFGLTATASGVMVSPDAAIRVPAVSAALRIISEAVASLPRMVKELAGDGTEKDAPGHAVNAILSLQSNDWTPAFQMVRDLVLDALTDNRGGMLWVNRLSDGRVAELIRYTPGTITVDYDQATGEPSYRLNNVKTPRADMVHLRAPFDKAPLDLAREAIAVAMLLATHAEGLFSNGARPGGVLKFPKGMGEESVKKAIAAWRATHEGGAKGKTAILHDGAEYEALSFSSTDAQFIENRKFQVLEIARCFRTPPSMLFDLDRATWGNVEQLGKEFLTYCLEPWLCALEGAFTQALFSGADQGRYVVRFDRDDLTRADLRTRATTINSLIASEVINPDEGRAWLGLAPRVDGGGKRYGNRNIRTDLGGAPKGAA